MCCPNMRIEESHHILGTTWSGYASFSHVSPTLNGYLFI